MTSSTANTASFDYQHYRSLKTKAERAKYLLSLPITAKVDIEFPNLVMRAHVDEVALHITGNSEEEVIAEARQWLQEQTATWEGEVCG
jgi:hypothetical protein